MQYYVKTVVTNLNQREYEATWQIKYFLAPAAGGIISGAIYLLITAGLIVLSADANTEQPRDFVIYIIAFFAGAIQSSTAYT